MRLNIFSYIAVIMLLITGCKKEYSPQLIAQIAVSNSYLRAVVEHVCGDNTTVLEIVPPGMCPGHFDISPSKVNQLAACRLLLVFDFQNNLSHSMGRLKDSGLEICAVEAPQGLCVPESYLQVVRNVADILSRVYPEKAEYYRLRLDIIEHRVDALSSQVQQMIQQGGLNGKNVLTSKHQSVFAQWLGLNVISTFTGKDTESVSRINDTLLKANLVPVDFIIANKQEGTAMADAIGNHLNIAVVMFSNFPQACESDIPSFDFLVMQNINNLLQAVKDE